MSIANDLCTFALLRDSNGVVGDVVTSFSVARKARQLLFHSSTVLGVADGVDDGVVHSVGLSEDGSPDGEKRGDGRLADHTSVVDDEVRSPGHEPEGHGHEGNLSQTAFSRGLLALIGSERLDSHLLSLFTHLILVVGNSLDDESVEVDVEEQGEDVYPDRVDVQVAVGEGVFGQVVSTAGSHVTFRYISVPSEERRKAPSKGSNPGTSNSGHSTAVGQGSASYTLNNDIVTVEGDPDHGPDGDTTVERSEESIDLTEESTESPGLPIARDDHWREHAEHHEEVREGQVDNEQVSWGTKRLGVHEHPDNDEVANNGHASHDDHPETNKAIPERIHWGVLVPMGINHMEEFFGHSVDYCVVPVGVGRGKGIVGEVGCFIPIRHLCVV